MYTAALFIQVTPDPAPLPKPPNSTQLKSFQVTPDPSPPPKPPNSTQFKFSKSFDQQSVGPPKSIHQTFLLTTKDHLDEIDAKYNEIITVRERIDDLLKGFKQSLHVGEKSELPLCFQRLRECAGDFETLELDGEELRIIVGEDADENVKEPVSQFNEMLKECREFQGKQQSAHEFVQGKISAVEKETVQTQATQEALQRAKEQLNVLLKWGKEIKSLVIATKSASIHLQPRNITGIIRIIED